MGNICNGNHDREDPKDQTETHNKNFPICQFNLMKFSTVDLVYGNTSIMQAHIDAIKEPSSSLSSNNNF